MQLLAYWGMVGLYPLSLPRRRFEGGNGHRQSKAQKQGPDHVITGASENQKLY